MREVAIIGAGESGGAIAHLLARQDLARSIRIVDEAGSIAGGKALDIAQAAPVQAFATQISGTDDVASAAGASTIVVADRASSPRSVDEALQLVKRVAQLAPRAVILCAGTSDREVIDRAVRDFKLSRLRVFGSAPEALVGGARALIALALNGSPGDVAVSVVGGPPDHIVVTWHDAAIAGVAATRLLNEAKRRRLNDRIVALWPPGPYALAAAAVATIGAMAGRSRRAVSCFVGPDISSGTRTRTAAMPVRLGPSGIVEVITPTLSAAEQVALENAMGL